jgi:HSP20 family protein
VGRMGDFTPRLDFAEQKDKYVLKLDLPGVDKNAIRITATEELLSISGERRTEWDETSRQGMHRVERSFGFFERTLPMPANVKTDQVAAKYEQGVLTVELPKQAQAAAQVKPERTIQVQ